MDVISGRFLINGELKDTSVGFEDGKIVTVGNIVRGADRIFDYKNRVILPGFVDSHVHFREPGFTSKEDFRSGSISAAYGGVTCVLDMPNNKPATTDTKSFREKKSLIKSKAYVDYGLFAALTPDCDVQSLAGKAVGFKLFMGSTTGNILMNSDRDISEVMKNVRLTGKVVSVHAEDDSLILREPERNCLDHLRNRPLKAEQNALARLSVFKGMKINICHVTDASTVDSANALGFTTEVTAHHLFFCAENNTTAEFKVNPPLRKKDGRDMLYRAFAEGKINSISTDHAPHTLAEKSQDFDTAPSGVPGVETTIPIFMNFAKKGTVPLGLVSKMGSENPSKLFSLNKGKIAVGYDADFSVFDTKKSSVVKAEKLHSKSGFTPYEGMEAIFPEAVFVRGEQQIDSWELCGGAVGGDVVDRN